ncbi:hypothetical protein OROGR_009730 [Orobanche gracilis]
MRGYQENSSKLLSVSSSENRYSFRSWKTEACEGDEEFYEEIEAPKFVDFTVPDHYCPDDRYWFCLRVGCDQKHEEEMDSEALYKKFVLRVMAARSPNVRLRKALARDGSRKCPLSAPPKPSKPRLPTTAIISSMVSKKMSDGDKEKVVRPLSKLKSATPVTKTKQVAAKYLTTPRHKKCIQNDNSFRSVRNLKPSSNTDTSEGRVVSKALVFQSPKKTIKVTTSVEMCLPVSKLCEGVNKLEISNQRKLASKSSKNLSRNQKAKSGKSIRSVSIQEGGSKTKQHLAHEEEEEASMSLMVPQPTNMSNSASPGKFSEKKGNCLDLEESNNSRSQATDMHEDSSSDGKEKNVDRLAARNSSEGERDDHECMDGDDKENAAAVSDENRMQEKNMKQNGRKMFAMHDRSGHVRKKVNQAQDKIKEGVIFSSPLVKLKKPKATNPKPFRLRTDERWILKEANLEKRTNHVGSQSESATLSTLSGKLQMKQGNVDQCIKTLKGQERSKLAAAATVTPESKKHRDRKTTGSRLESNAMQRLEKFRKIKPPIHKHPIRPQWLVSTKNETTTFLAPGQKLDVIHEDSPHVLELKRDGKLNDHSPDAAAACAGSRSSSRGRRPITVPTEPNFHSTHLPRTCTKKLK